MAQNQLDVSNAALSKLGCRIKLTASQVAGKTSPSLTGTTQEERVCARRVDVCKCILLAMHPWNFAIKRANLEPSYANITGAVSDGSSDNEVRITSATHGLSDGMRVTIKNVTGTTEANGTWVVKNSTTNTFDLDDSTFSNTYVSGGQWTRAATFDFIYSIALPTDCIRVLRVNDNLVSPDWKIESGRMLTNDDTNYLKYVYDIGELDSAYATMNIMFYEALALYLAWDISLELGRDNGTKEQLGRDFKEVLSKARFVDAMEDPAEQIEANDWVSSRLMYRGANSDPRYW
jgi:hypothetical protein